MNPTVSTVKSLLEDVNQKRRKKEKRKKKEKYKLLFLLDLAMVAVLFGTVVHEANVHILA